MNERGEGSKSLLWIVLVAIVLLLILWATGILDFDAEGDLEAPAVEVSGGEVPDIDADVADISTGTETVEVPTLEVEGADASAEDDDGNN